jgi:hypothetical protein
MACLATTTVLNVTLVFMSLRPKPKAEDDFVTPKPTSRALASPQLCGPSGASESIPMPMPLPYRHPYDLNGTPSLMMVKQWSP